VSVATPMRLRVEIVAAGLAAAIVALPASALAHAPIPGVGAFWNGLVHPMLALPHLLVLVGLGLLLGQNAPRGSRAGLAAFAFALVVAVALARTPGPAPAILAAVSAAAGLAVALERAHPALVVLLALAGAAAVGLDSAPEGTAGDVLARGGVIAGALMTVILVGGLAAALERGWQRVGLRAGGSWIAAASILILAFDGSGTGPQ